MFKNVDARQHYFPMLEPTHSCHKLINHYNMYIIISADIEHVIVY